MHKIIGLVVALVVIGGGIYWYTSKPASTPSPAEVMEEKPTAETGLMANLKEIVASGKAMHCTYNVDDSGITTESWIQGDKMRTEGTIGGVKSIVVADKDNQYIWSSASKQGMKLSTVCMEKMAKTMPESKDSKMPSMQDAKAAFEFAKNVKCEPVESVDTNIPTDITFTDQCAMMEKLNASMEQMGKSLPEGMTLPSGQ